MRPQDLLDRLAAGYEYDPMYGALCNERDQLKAENAKLRECLQDLVEHIREDDTFGLYYDWILNHMRELGIEVPS